VHVFEFLSNATEALARYGPSLGPKVLLASFAAAVVTWAGFNFLPRGHRDALDQALLAYTAGAFFSLLLMYVAGGLHLYSTGILWLAVLLTALSNPRNAFRLPRGLGRPGWKILPFIALGVGPLLVSLTNPTPSWMDVLEGNVAPIQRLITFEAFDPRTALPSALYPANRATPLYTAFYGLNAQLVNLDAYEILAASLIPIVLVTLLAAYRLGRVLLPENAHAGWMSALSWVLTCNYLQLQSARSTVWQMTFTLIAITKVIELSRNPASFRLLVECAVVSAASVLAHPLEGMFTVLAVMTIATAVLARERFAYTRRYAAAAVIGVGAGAPILPTWWPESPAAWAGGVLLLLLIPLATAAGRSSETAINRSRLESSSFLTWAPVAVVVSTIALQWDFYGTVRRSYLAQEMMRYPVPTTLTLTVIGLAILQRRFRTTAVLSGAALLAATVPLWVVRLIDLDPVTAASMRYELALKSTEYWLSGILTVCGSAVLAHLWIRRSRYTPLTRLACIALLTVSVPTMLGIPVGEAHRAAGIYGMWKWQIRLAGEGYWGGWRRRTIVGGDDHELYRALRSYVNHGEIGLGTRIAHVAERPDLKATPFPAFTGITQDFYLPEVDRANIHTYSGRLYDLDDRPPTGEWILVERSLEPRLNIDPARIVFQNERVVLVRKPANEMP
jgi:hypothetical protein